MKTNEHTKLRILLLLCFLFTVITNQGQNRDLERNLGFSSPHIGVFSKWKNLDIDFKYTNKGNRINYYLKSSEIIKQSLDSIVWQYLDTLSGNFHPAAKKEYTYDSNGNFNVGITFHWDDSASKWIWDVKEEYTFDTNGNLTLRIDYEWDENTSKWVWVYKEEFTYDKNGILTLRIDYEWDEYSSKWIGNYKFEFIHDSNDNFTLSIVYDWDETSSKWVGVEKEEYIYDNNFVLNDLLIPSELLSGSPNIFLEHKVTERTYYKFDINSDKWVYNFKEKYYYSDRNITNTVCTSIQEFKVYPNPSTDYINIDYPNNNEPVTIEIYDYLGRMVYRDNGVKINNIYVGHLNRGYYLCKIIYKDQVFKTKIILQ